MDNNKKLIINSSFTPSLINFRKDLIQKFIMSNYKVYCTGPEVDSDTISELNAIGAEFIKSPISRNGSSLIGDLYYVLFLVRLYIKLKPDVVLSYTIKPLAYGTIAAYITGIKKRLVLITGLGLAFNQNKNEGILVNIKKIIGRGLLRIGVNLSTHAFFQNSDDLSRIVKSESLREKSWITNGSGINTDKYYYKERNSSGGVKFLMIARLIEEKGVLDFIKAATILKNKDSTLTFTLIGWFENTLPEIKNLVEEAVENKIIDFKGKQSNILEFLHDCDVFVLPSYYPEGVPRVLLEALASGRAIITTNSVGCKETIEHEYNGLLIEPKNCHSLVLAMETFIQNTDLIDVYGLASRELAVNKFCVNKVNQYIFNKADLYVKENI